MKHLRAYEQNQEKKFYYWEIIGKSKTEYILCLKKINISSPFFNDDDELEDCFEYYDDYKNYDKLYITYEDSPWDACDGWWIGNEDVFMEMLNDKNMDSVKNMGKVIVTPEEIEEYEIQHKSKKYNI